MEVTIIGLDVFFQHNTQVGYFRKVNFLVSFFEHRGYELHNRIPYSITVEDAKELLRRCDEVLKDHSKAQELLPTRSGFFFGSTEYDNYYYEDVEKVRNYVRDKLIPLFGELDNDDYIDFIIDY